jgi:hypothetical protein
MDNTSAKVKVGNKLSESFQFNSGVTQGDGLPTTPFNIALHSVINNVDRNGTLFLKCSQICAHADDLLIVTRDVNTDISGFGKGDPEYWTWCEQKKYYLYDSINITDKKKPTEFISGREKL